MYIKKKRPKSGHLFFDIHDSDKIKAQRQLRQMCEAQLDFGADTLYPKKGAIQ